MASVHHPAAGGAGYEDSNAGHTGASGTDGYGAGGYEGGGYETAGYPAYGTYGGDMVTEALGGLGAQIDCTGLRNVPLEGPQVLWLVAGGAMDLFAVDATGQGHWHYLGRLGPGTLLIGPVAGPQHTLVGRPLQECVLRRIQLRELYRPEPGADGYWADGYATDAYGNPVGGQGNSWDSGAWDSGSWDTWGNSSSPDGALSPLEDAFAVGVGRSTQVLFQAPLNGQHADPDPYGSDEDILWMPVSPGSLHYGASYGGDAVGDLLIDGAMWQRMVNQQYRLLTALDRWIERLERAHEDRTAAGIEAGENVRAHADQALLASINSTGKSPGTAAMAGDDATLAVCRRVAEAGGITLTAPAESGSWNDRMNPVERIALSSRVRTRVVRLSGRWWRENSGPLVGQREASGAPVALLWRRGGYEAVGPDGERTRIGKGNEERYASRAVMFYRPLPDEPLSMWGLVRFCLGGTRMDLRNLLLGGLVAVALGALVPVATGQVLGVFVPNAETGLIVQVSLALVVSSVVAAVFMLLQNISILRMEGRVEASLQPAVWDRLLSLPTKFFAHRSTGELASAAMGISTMRRLLSGVGPIVVQACTVGTMNLVLLLLYSAPLALVGLLLLVVIAAVFLGLGLWQLRWQRELIELTNRLNNQAFQSLRGLPKLRVAAAESFAYAAWAREFARSRELQQRVGRIKNLTAVLNAVYLPLCSLVMFMLIAGPARGALSSSAFLTFNTAVTMMLTQATQLTNALISAYSALPMFEQIKPVLHEAPEVREGSTQPGTLSGGMEARQLSFRYSDDGPLVLDDVSFEVRPGEFVAVVGASGCGKSTLLRLLIGFDRPTSGTVLYDGQDLSALDQSSVRRQCGVVLQNSQPFTGSILDSICGAEMFSQDEAWEAAAMAGLAEDIKRMPMGMHTMLSDGGGTISGGQRQRLMIAQALIRKPRILFFDEATSALDNETQRIVIDSTRKLQASRVVIAHRLSTVMDADRVVVMSDGRVVQQGTPAELLADTGGQLHGLVRRQMR